MDTGGAGMPDKGQLNSTCLQCLGFHFSRRLCLPRFPCHVLLIKLQLAWWLFHSCILWPNHDDDDTDGNDENANDDSHDNE